MLERTAVPTRPMPEPVATTGLASRRPLAAATVIALAWVCVLATVVIALHRGGGAPTSQVIAYLAAWVLGCTLPGVLVWRALAGHSTIVRELGFGSVLGVVLQLLAWAAATSVHRPVLLAALPVGVAVMFLVVPRLRRHWWPRRTAATRTPARWHVAMAVVVALAAYRFERLAWALGRDLPPKPSIVNRDTLYNSALSYELSRTVRPQDPFVAGEPLRYHWFADAHVTATAQLSGTPISTAMITLWLVPMLVVLLFVVAAAAQHLMDGPPVTAADGALLSDVRRWWAGPVAAFFWYAAPAIWRFGRPVTVAATDGFVPSSPSGVLALALVCCLVGPVFDLLRGRSNRGTWVVLTLLLVACGGTKPSLLPVVAFGALLVLVVELVRTRRVCRPMAYLVGAAALITAVAAPFVTGSTGGSHPQLLALVGLDPSYARLLDGRPVFNAAGGWLVPALADRLPHAVPVVGMLLLVWLLTETPRLLSLVGLAAPPLRGDAGLRWACGVLIGGYGAMWVLAHPGGGQHWFWSVTLALSTAVVVTNAVRVLPASRRAWTLVPPLLVVALPGLLAGYLTTTWGRVDLDGPTRTVIEDRLRPYALVLAALAVAILATVLLRQLARRWSVPLLTAVTAFALAASLPLAVVQVRAVRAPDLHRAKAGVTYTYISPEQQRAALWLNRHSATTSVVATNVFCWQLGARPENCALGSMWLAGLSGRRMVLSDWTFSATTEARYDGTRALNQIPTPWPDRLRLSLDAVENPTPQALGRLRTELGGRWIFADRRASRISPRLSELATLRYQSRNIQIYRLADSYGA